MFHTFLASILFTSLSVVAPGAIFCHDSRFSKSLMGHGKNSPSQSWKRQWGGTAREPCWHVRAPKPYFDWIWAVGLRTGRRDALKTFDVETCHAQRPSTREKTFKYKLLCYLCRLYDRAHAVRFAFVLPPVSTSLPPLSSNRGRRSSPHDVATFLMQSCFKRAWSCAKRGNEHAQGRIAGF